jgi:hypothetical protein
MTIESTPRTSWWRRLFGLVADSTRDWRRGVGL